ncbi:MAG: hemerythrin family protein, partial [Gallionellaceae bacterium]|nr:hemerythrin family protein [Gallionellaceae bacterium]
TLYFELFNHLESYVQRLFPEEEAMMDSNGYPFVNVQALEHKTFIQEFTELRKEIEAGIDDPVFLFFRIQVMLFDWFCHHISRNDRHFSRYLANLKPQLG